MPPRRILWVIVVGSSLLAGCEKSMPASTVPLATEVKVARPIVKDVTDFEEFTGHTEAIRSVQVTSRVTGYLLKRDFQEGSEVKEGDLLYEIDNRPYKAALDLANARVARSEAHRRRLESDQKRSSNLFQRAAIGKAEFDIVTSDYAEAQAMLNAARAQLEEARLDFSFTQIKAPMSGQISRSLVEPGNLVRQQTTVLTDIVDTRTLYVYFDINEEVLSRVRDLIEQGRVDSVDGKQVRVDVGLSDEEGYSLKSALVNFSENKIDAATGTLRIRGVIENPEPAIKNPAFSMRVRPGLFIRVRLPIGSPHPTLLVPEDALGSDQGRMFVYVVNSADEVVYRPVEIGQSFEGFRSIAGGLSKDERIVIDGLQRVRPGSKVVPDLITPGKPAAKVRKPGTA